MFAALTPYEVSVLVSLIASGIFAAAVSLMSLVWWLSKQFASTRHLVYDKIDYAMKTILEKLEYHERYDDQRFTSISNDLWDIRVRNAARDGLAVETRNKVNDKE